MKHYEHSQKPRNVKGGLMRPPPPAKAKAAGPMAGDRNMPKIKTAQIQGMGKARVR